HPIDADPGKHIVELRSGAVSSRKEIDLRSGEATTVTLALPLPPPSAAPAPVAPSMAAARAPSPFPARTLVLGVSGALAVTGLVAGTAAMWLASEHGQLAEITS